MSWKKSVLSILVLGIAACGGPKPATEPQASRIGGASLSAAAATPNAFPGAPVAITQPRKFVTERKVIPPTSSFGGKPWIEYNYKGDQPIAPDIYGTKAFSTNDDGLNMVDLLTGEITTVKSENMARQGESQTNFNSGETSFKQVLTKIDGVRFTLAPFLLVNPGTGTSPDTTAVEIFGFATENPSTLFSMILPMGTTESARSIGSDLNLYASTNGRVALSYSRGNEGEFETQVIDLQQKKSLITYPNFKPTRVSGEALLGNLTGAANKQKFPEEYQRFSARSMAKSATLWTGLKYPSYSGALSLNPFAPGISFVVSTTVATRGTYQSIRFINDEKGKDIRKPIISEANGGLQCQYDGRSLTLCLVGASDKATLTAFDAKTAAVKSEIIKSGSSRIMPEINYIWDGTIYGKTRRGPLMIDAKTAQDIPDENPMEILFVNEFLAITITKTSWGEVATAVATRE